MSNYYLGDPCYIIPDDEWDEFCQLTFEHNGSSGNHLDSVINWRGQEIEIWSNGGDGTWSFYGLKTKNNVQEFGVDAGIFCVIDLEMLPRFEGDPAEMGMIFEYEPDLYVENGVVYINGVHDDSMQNCYECGNLVHSYHGVWSCDTGNCEGCEECFECNCCNECGRADEKDDCSYCEEEE
jgi:hypothetical protein